MLSEGTEGLVKARLQEIKIVGIDNVHCIHSTYTLYIIQDAGIHCIIYKEQE